MSDISKFWDTYHDTAPEKVTPEQMSDETLKACHAYFLDALHIVQDRRTMFHACEARIALLAGEIAQRRASLQSDQQHQENQALGRKTLAVSESGLFWAKIAGIAAVVGIVVLLWKDTPLSKLLPAKASEASPASLLTTQAIVLPSQSPKAIESPLESPQASETPSVTAEPTAEPLQSPQKLPPPAP